MPGILDTVALQNSLDPAMLDTIARIESGGNPNARTGSYKGLFQLSDQEFNKYGGGDIYSASDNAAAAARKIAAEADAFRQQYGREPTPTDIYMVHQQGQAGYGAHLTNPDQPAWQSMASTGEGRQKGAGWAKQAIWGNIPDQFKSQFGNVNNITSQQFVDLWRQKVEGQPGRPLNVGGVPSPQPPQNNAPAGFPVAQGAPANPFVPAMSAQPGEDLPQIPPAPLMSFAQLRRPQINFAGFQRLLQGRA